MVSTGYIDTVLLNVKECGLGSEGGVMYSSGYLVILGAKPLPVVKRFGCLVGMLKSWSYGCV